MEAFRLARVSCPGYCLLASAVLLLSGCASGPTWLPWGGPHTDHVAGITPPAERIAEVAGLGERARRASSAEKREIGSQLAAAIREEEDPMIRAAVVRALRYCEGPESDGVLQSALQDPSGDVRVAACEVLGQRGGNESIRLLGERLGSDMDKDVRLAAARALGETGDPEAVAALGNVLADADPAMQYRAVLSLKNVTGKDFGNDVTLWQQYVRGELPKREQVAEQLPRWNPRSWF